MQKVYNVGYRLKGSKTLFWVLYVVASNEKEAKKEARHSLDYYPTGKKITIVEIERV